MVCSIKDKKLSFITAATFLVQNWGGDRYYKFKVARVMGDNYIAEGHIEYSIQSIYYTKGNL